MKVPKELVAPLSENLGLSYHTVYNWKKYGVPEHRQEEVERAMAEIEQDRVEVEVSSWIVEPLRKLMNTHRKTVWNWYAYGVPRKRRKEVKEAIDMLNNKERNNVSENNNTR